MGSETLICTVDSPRERIIETCNVENGLYLQHDYETVRGFEVKATDYPCEKWRWVTDCHITLDNIFETEGEVISGAAFCVNCFFSHKPKGVKS